MAKHKKSRKKSHRSVSSRRRRGARRAGKHCPEVCPIIHISSHMKPVGSKRVRDWSVSREEYVWKKVAQPPRKAVTVKLGNRTIVKNATGEAASKVVANLRKRLLDRRCQAVIEQTGAKLAGFGRFKMRRR